MFFNIKHIAIFGLVGLSNASPLPELSKRAQLGDFQCPDGSTIYEHDIREAFHECRRNDDGSIGKYPAYFGNQSNNQRVFGNIPDGTDLREFPIIKDGVYSGGVPGAYRVVTDYKNNRGDFRGVMQHTGATVGGAYTACTRITNTKRESAIGADLEVPDSNKIQVTETDNSDETTKHTVNDLETRTKKKKVGSASCPDGTTLSKEDVGNAFSECKKSDDYGHGGYPHSFGNQSGGGQVFEGVTKSLREYPIIQGGTWTNGEPGKYRIVTDYNNKLVGVMIENAGASFERCTLNDD